jgi:hypothetical protein
MNYIRWSMKQSLQVIFTGIAAAYVGKSGKQAGKFSRKSRNCKICSDVAFHGQIYMNVNQQL